MKLTKTNIAKDVLELLRLRKAKATKGRYVEILSDLPNESCDLQEAMQDPKFKCEVCAKGALLLAAAHLDDDVPLWRDFSYKDGYNRSTLHNEDVSVRLSKTNIFAQKDLDTIERFFEGWTARSKSNNESELIKKFRNRYRSAPGRLRAIMQNIIDNRGRFVPRKLVEERSK